ncbi:MFS transporter [Aromatoleum diolicum]|uniref:MFS transporter n=2 Tax=Aromatoleum diolicum TaxID=75796 RepID=A0ABX1Q6S0_9RHOO|nr:multidrug effflux MFS transporter [Aromatoleum diolicum]NMG73693.1 MFS transporter [Aromatoleum diolicum]
MGPVEFVAFVALSLVVGAVAVDLVLPALLPIGEDFALGSGNFSQTVIAVYLLGVGVPQLLLGPLSDCYGRRPVLIGGLLVFLMGSVLGAFAPDFHTLLAARLLQGIGAGAQRVVTFSIVRDHYAGAQMTRVMSLAMSVVLLEPIVAPMLGQLILLAGSWRWVMGAVGLVAAGMLGWVWLRLDESLPGGPRGRPSPRAVFGDYRTVVTTREAIVSMVVCGLVMGAHLGFLSSAQAIFQIIFGAGLRFTLLLAAVSLAMSAASLANARLARRIGNAVLIRRTLLGVAGVNAAALAFAATGEFALPAFLAVQAGNMFAFGLLLPNLTSMSMNPLGHIAGTASSMYGFVSTTVGALLGGIVGQCFDGSVRPLFAAYALLGLAGLAAMTRSRR